MKSRDRQLRDPSRTHFRRHGKLAVGLRGALAAALARTHAALRRAIAARHRRTARIARDDERGWVVKRRERTRQLIELGGLVAKAGLIELTDDDRAVIFGILVDAAAAAAPSGRIERATRKAKGAADPGGFAEVRQGPLTINRVQLPGSARPASRDRHPKGPRREGDSVPRKRGRAQSRKA
ncbi:conjugal transfer protein TraD [Sphingomonas suaedae]|uniref:Conjugal transfer protein TraD n=1 Tax=Sphingomonas suaedae TaxID=2599297 RepID=A0A518RFD0_9SPHN|nr:conjugal transfer protein TraD [Sphingomonas suaedae]